VEEEQVKPSTIRRRGPAKRAKPITGSGSRDRVLAGDLNEHDAKWLPVLFARTRWMTVSLSIDSDVEVEMQDDENGAWKSRKQLRKAARGEEIENGHEWDNEETVVACVSPSTSALFSFTDNSLQLIKMQADWLHVVGDIAKTAFDTFYKMKFDAKGKYDEQSREAADSIMPSSLQVQGGTVSTYCCESWKAN
jgi:hypothetical protein